MKARERKYPQHGKQPWLLAGSKIAGIPDVAIKDTRGRTLGVIHARCLYGRR